MRKENSKMLKQLIIIVGTILITLGAVIFSELSLDKKILYFEIGIAIFIVLGISYILVTNYGTMRYTLKQRYKQLLKIEGRVKKDIKRLKNGKKIVYISVGDIGYILRNKEKLRDIKDIKILFDYVDDYSKQLGEIVEKGMPKFYGDEEV